MFDKATAAPEHQHKRVLNKNPTVEETKSPSQHEAEWQSDIRKKRCQHGIPLNIQYLCFCQAAEFVIVTEGKTVFSVTD